MTLFIVLFANNNLKKWDLLFFHFCSTPAPSVGLSNLPSPLKLESSFFCVPSTLLHFALLCFGSFQFHFVCFVTKRSALPLLYPAFAAVWDFELGEWIECRRAFFYCLQSHRNGVQATAHTFNTKFPTRDPTLSVDEKIPVKLWKLKEVIFFFWPEIASTVFHSGKIR